MIEEALQYIAALQTPKNPITVQVGDQNYAVTPQGTLGAVVVEQDVRPARPTLLLQTLSGLVAAFNAKIDKLGDRVGFSVADAFNVTLIDIDADEFGKRRVYAKATHTEKAPFPFNNFLAPEPFLLAFRAGFLFTDDAVKVQQLCSTVTSGDAVTVLDDGVSQEVVVRSGTITKSTVALPQDGIPLIANRTFRDANPVEARYLLRMKGAKDGLPLIALFEIDAMWELNLVASIRNYLQAQLPGIAVIA